MLGEFITAYIFFATIIALIILVASVGDYVLVYFLGKKGAKTFKLFFPLAVYLALLVFVYAYLTTVFTV